MIETYDAALRISAAVLAGGAIGLDRGLHGKPTGVRVHGLVALASAGLVVAANSTGDPTATARIIQGIMSGIGFLGAGVILRGDILGLTGKLARPPGAPSTKSVTQIHYLTTAATIWLTAAIGALCGLGLWPLTLMVVAAALLLLVFGFAIDRMVFAKLGHEPDIGDPVE